MANDPVCGMQVDARTAAGTTVFDDQTYNFCSATRKQKFDAEPSAYTSAVIHAGDATQHAGDRTSAPPAIASTAGDAIYTCPMHPEIVSHAPGSCPKCGMALVPVAGGCLRYS